MTDIVDELKWRGLIALSTDEDALRKAFADGPVTFYCGFDPTAPSLHLGNLVQILTMRRIQQAGHRPLGLVGGATGLIGDPKPTAERTLNAPETVAEWVERLRGQIAPLLDFDGPNAAVMVNNLDWTQGLSAIEFLRDIGKHFRVNKMIAKEAVSRRLNSDAGISYTEFSYQILQGMDFLELYRRYGCTLQTGGSDQWGNLTSGTDLIHRVEPDAVVHALGTPLITKADGTKFGKTESGTVWLDPEMTTPYAFYQFWINADDRDVAKFLRIFSFRSHEEIEELERLTEERPQARAAAGAGRGADHAGARSRADGRGDRRVEGAVRAGRADGAGRQDAGVGAVRGAAHPGHRAGVRGGPVRRGGPGREQVRGAQDREGGGAYVNNVKVTAEDAVASPEDLLDGRWLVLRRGKRNLAAVEVVAG